MSDHEDRAAMEKQAERASARLAAGIDALEAKAEHAKNSAVRDLKAFGAAAAVVFVIKVLLDSLARRREARDARVALVRKVVLPAPLLVAAASLGVLYLARRRP